MATRSEPGCTRQARTPSRSRAHQRLAVASSPWSDTPLGRTRGRDGERGPEICVDERRLQLSNPSAERRTPAACPASAKARRPRFAGPDLMPSSPAFHRLAAVAGACLINPATRRHRSVGRRPCSLSGKRSRGRPRLAPTDRAVTAPRSRLSDESMCWRRRIGPTCPSARVRDKLRGRSVDWGVRMRPRHRAGATVIVRWAAPRNGDRRLS